MRGKTVYLSTAAHKPLLLGCNRYLLPHQEDLVVGGIANGEIEGFQLTFLSLFRFVTCLHGLLPDLFLEKPVDKWVDERTPLRERSQGDKISGSRRTPNDAYKIHFRTFLRSRTERGLYLPSKIGCTFDWDELQEFVRQLEPAFLLASQFSSDDAKTFAQFAAKGLLDGYGPDPPTPDQAPDLLDRAQADNYRILRDLYEEFKPSQPAIRFESFVANNRRNLINLLAIGILQRKIESIDNEDSALAGPASPPAIADKAPLR